MNGVSDGGRAAYKGAACVLGLEDIRKELKAGDLVPVSGRTLAVSAGGRTLLRRTLPEKPLILPFDRRTFRASR